MQKVFVSSVINGFEEFRTAVRSAIALMGDRPIMAEDFGARPHSSEAACLSEVAQSDVYLLVMGESFGFETEQGISVTQAEFREAKATGKPILVFVQGVEMEPRQLEFRKEVENYESGFFRASFSDALTLKDEIILGLRQFDQALNAADEAEFEQRLKTGLQAIEPWAEPDPLMTVSFWPQPVREVDIVGLEQHLDARFATLCTQGLAEMKQGYEPIIKRDHTGLKSGDSSINYFDDGLLVIKTRPIVKKEDGFFSSMFVPPSLVENIATGASALFEGSGAWCQIALSDMQGKNFAELPDSNTSSVSMNMFSDDHAAFNQCMIPFTKQAYQQWVAKAVKRFGRIFSER